VQTLPGAGIFSDSNLLDKKICNSLKKITYFRKEKPRLNVENVYAHREEVKDFLEKTFAMGCESRNMKVQRKNISNFF
jgi:hypothetical protein